MHRSISTAAVLTGALWLSTMPLSSQAEVFCVDTATGLQTALSTAAINGEDDEVRIVQGTYFGNFRYVSAEGFDLSIQGGWSPACATQEVDPSNTILDGAQNDTVLVLSVPSATAKLMLHGATLRNGYQSSAGGGLKVKGNDSGSLTVTFSAFNFNTSGAGGGVDIESLDSATFINNTFRDNVATLDGGGARIRDLNSITMTNNTISGNASGNVGGGVYAKSFGRIAFSNNSVDGNSANGNRLYGGGGVFARSRIITFSHNTVSENASGYYGGGVHVDGSDMVTFSGNLMKGNVARVSGGGIYSSNSRSVAFVNNVIDRNGSDYYGGGIYAINPSRLRLTNNTLVGNADRLRGGGLYVRLLESSPASDGTIFGRWNDQNQSDIESQLDYGATLYNNIFLSNNADDAADFYINNDSDYDRTPSPVALSHNNFDQTPGLGYGTNIPVIIDPNNLDAVDPLFVDPDSGDLSLLPDSPMINAGDPETPDLPATDIIGNPRVFGGVVDIGAYEWRDAPVLDGECLLDWAETEYPRSFAPAGVETVDRSPLFYRVYSQSRTALGYNEERALVYFRNREGEVRDMGALETWLERAGCLTQ